jgi:putative two-component system response regulator
LDGIDAVHPSARLLAIDDEDANLRLIERILERAGYRQVRCVQEPRLAVDAFLEVSPDLVILDLNMPYLNGYGLLEQLQSHIADSTYLPILVVTGDGSLAARRRALSAGAKDFVTKPYDRTEVLLRIRNLLEVRFLHLALHAQNGLLEEKVLERTRALEEAQLEILERLALAAEFRDDATRQHTRRVGVWSARLARRLGLPDETVELLRRAAPLHDLGKVAVPDTILLKLGRLTEHEFSVMRSHVQVGARILSGSNHPLLQLAEQIALTHHERWDGSGYTPGLAGEQIPLAARIVAIVDVFDALTHARPYKPAWRIEDAVREIEQQRGRQFDPAVVDAFLSLLEEDGLLTRPASGAPAAGRLTVGALRRS